MALFGGMFGSAGKSTPISTSFRWPSTTASTCNSPRPAMTSRRDRGDDTPRHHRFPERPQPRGHAGVVPAKSLRATVDPSAQTLTLSIATPEEIESELKVEHGAVKVLHVVDISMRAEALSGHLAPPPSQSRQPQHPQRRRPLPRPRPPRCHPLSNISKPSNACACDRGYIRQARAVDHGRQGSPEKNQADRLHTRWAD